MQLRSVIGFGWVLFVAYWWISAIGVKKDVRRRSWRWETGGRILAIAVVFALTRLPATRAFFQGGRHRLQSIPPKG